MPNWCHNTLYITGPGSDAAALRALMTTAESEFDFDSILPMPEELRQSESSSTAETAWQLKYGVWSEVRGKYGPDHHSTRDAAIEVARAADDWRPMMIGTKDNPFPVIPPRSFDALADSVQALVIRHGHADWHSWACATWGTKWPARDSGWMTLEVAAENDAAQVAHFDTAWSPPVGVLVALSRRFPTLTLRVSFDDWCGGLRGFMAVQDGEMTADKSETYSPEAD
jgi:hypothetical protein